MPNSDLFYSYAITRRYYFALDIDGGLWKTIHKNSLNNSLFTKVNITIPPCKTMYPDLCISNDDSSLFLIDFDGQLWIFNYNDNSVVKHEFLNDVVSLAFCKKRLYSLSSGGCIYYCNDNNYIQMENIPQMMRLSADFICAAIDYNGNVWKWDDSLTLQKVYISDIPAKSLVVENTKIKIIGESGKLYKYDTICETATALFSSHIPPIKSISVSGNHTIVIDNDNYLWYWGITSHLSNYNYYHNNNTPMKLPEKTWHSAISGSNSSLALSTEGKLYELKGEIKLIEEIERVFIHQPFRFKSARK